MNCQHPGQPDTEGGGCILCWKERCEKAEAAAAEMRPLVAQLKKQEWEWDWSDFDLEHALSSSCGQGFLPPNKARVLVEALERITHFTAIGAEIVKEVQASQWHQMKQIAKEALDQLKDTQ